MRGGRGEEEGAVGEVRGGGEQGKVRGGEEEGAVGC